MNELVYLKNDSAITDSLAVAERFGKRHDNVLKAIENIIPNVLKNEVVKITKSHYTDSKGEKRPMYYMNRGAFELVVMGFTGKKAIEWKIKFITAFEAMYELISFRKADKQIQMNSMQFLHDNLEMPTAKDYMKANTIANKAVSTKYGYPKMIKKADMTPDMIEDRERILKDTVELMAAKEKFGLDVPIAEKIYQKYAEAV